MLKKRGISGNYIMKLVCKKETKLTKQSNGIDRLLRMPFNCISKAINGVSGALGLRLYFVCCLNHERIQVTYWVAAVLGFLLSFV